METRMDSTISVPLIMILTCMKIMAQTGSPGLDASIVGLVGNFGIMGVLVWHLWYHTTKSYPNMIDKFTVEQERMRQAHLKEQQELRDHCEKENSELRDMLLQNMHAARDAVHDVRNAVNTVVLKKQIDDRLESKDSK